MEEIPIGGNEASEDKAEHSSGNTAPEESEEELKKMRSLATLSAVLVDKRGSKPASAPPPSEPASASPPSELASASSSPEPASAPLPKPVSVQSASDPIESLSNEKKIARGEEDIEIIKIYSSAKSFRYYMRKLYNQNRKNNTLFKDMQQIYEDFNLNYLIEFEGFKSKLEGLPDIIMKNNKEKFKVQMLSFLGKVLQLERSRKEEIDKLIYLRELNYIDMICLSDRNLRNKFQQYIQSMITHDISDEQINNLQQKIQQVNKENKCNIKEIFGDKRKYGTIKDALKLAKKHKGYVKENNDLVKCILAFLSFYDEYELELHESEFLENILKYYPRIHHKELSYVYFLHNYFDMDLE